MSMSIKRCHRVFVFTIPFHQIGIIHYVVHKHTWKLCGYIITCNLKSMIFSRHIQRHGITRHRFQSKSNGCPTIIDELDQHENFDGTMNHGGFRYTLHIQIASLCDLIVIIHCEV